VGALVGAMTLSMTTFSKTALSIMIFSKNAALGRMFLCQVSLLPSVTLAGCHKYALYAECLYAVMLRVVMLGVDIYWCISVTVTLNRSGANVIKLFTSEIYECS
jgi:hypothetical protein